MKHSKPYYQVRKINSILGFNYRAFLFCFFFFFCLLISLFAQNSFALQGINIEDNQTKKISISKHDLSRIFVKDDRIQNVRGVEGAYILKKDAVLGQVFIKPTAPYQNKPFNLFITTEQGRNYNLFVTPSSIRGQDIQLKSNAPNKKGKKAILWEKNTAYPQALVNLITAMINNEAPEGYSVIYSHNERIKKSKSNKNRAKKSKRVKPIECGDCVVTLQKQYLGNRLYGEAFWVQNRSKHPIKLTENMFYQDGTRAIAFLNQDPVVPPKGYTMLFRVISDGGG